MCGYLIQWIFLPSKISWVKLTKKGVLRHFRPMFILFLPSIAISLYKVMDKIMLGNMSNISEVAYYTNAEDVINIPISIIGAVGTVMLSRTSNLVAKGKIDKSKKYIQDSLGIVSWLSIALMFGISAISYNFTITFWGERFTSCTVLIIILVLTIPFITVANIVRTQYLIPHNKDFEYLFSIIAGAVINFCINIFLIPILASSGAAIGTVFAEAGVCIIQIMFVRKDLPILKYLLKNMIYIVFGAIMFCALKIIDFQIDNKTICLFIQIVIGALIYIILSLIYLRFLFLKGKFCFDLNTIIKKNK